MTQWRLAMQDPILFPAFRHRTIHQPHPILIQVIPIKTIVTEHHHPSPIWPPFTRQVGGNLFCQSQLSRRAGRCPAARRPFSKPNMLEMGRTCRTCCDNLACVQYQHVLFYCLLVVCLIVCCLFGVNILVKTVWSQGSSLFIRRPVVGKCRKTRIVVVWKVVQDAGVGWILEGGCFGHPAQVSLHPPERCGFRPCKTD